MNISRLIISGNDEVKNNYSINKKIIIILLISIGNLSKRI